LLEEHASLLAEREANPMTDVEKQLAEEEEILRATEVANKLASAQEHAHGIKFNKSAPQSWRAPKYIREMPEEQATDIRKKFNIECTG